MNVFFSSLGCDKNLVDAEVMLGILFSHGYTITDEEAEADVIVVNTCCFIHDACEESIQTILEMASYKEDGKCRALIVTGCLASRYADEIHKEIPEVDAIVSATAYDQIAEAINGVLKKQTRDFIADINALPMPDTKRFITTGGHYAYLKIAEGCDKHCTYCAIPKMRGSYRSFPMERLVKEAEYLAEAGVKELILVAQETTLYGTDLYRSKSLPKLLRSLCKIDGIKWIRLLYCYPEEIDDELIEVIRTEPKVLHYLDMPVQHASDAILKRMGRKTDQASLRTLIRKLRSEIPDICIRTTLISGFPGETEADHKELLKFVKEMEFERLGVFTYSREEGTPAYDFDAQVDAAIAEDRRDEIMQLQQEISKKHGTEKTGCELEAFIEGKIVDDDVYAARTYMDAPEVDGFVFIDTDRELMSGDLVKVKITDANEYDLMGVLTDESAE
ncbi:MAG: 30S ribosomal protein S12 methylthiotransferase RimO [Lachnospiraceae bacterium]|nr:30S ribosomal protein S12 methylthiotransferase RimO [Lachnospiraceae bacterium]